MLVMSQLPEYEDRKGRARRSLGPSFCADARRLRCAGRPGARPLNATGAVGMIDSVGPLNTASKKVFLSSRCFLCRQVDPDSVDFLSVETSLDSQGDHPTHEHALKQGGF